MTGVWEGMRFAIDFYRSISVAREDILVLCILVVCIVHAYDTANVTYAAYPLNRLR